MMALKYRMLGILIFLVITPAHAVTVYNIPFQNVVLNPNVTIQGRYSFGTFPIIFCYENNLQSIGVFTWPYQGKTYTSTLSTPLVTNSNFQGAFADPSGTVTIRNNQSTALLVSCVFGF